MTPIERARYWNNRARQRREDAAALKRRASRYLEKAEEADRLAREQQELALSVMPVEGRA